MLKCFIVEATFHLPVYSDLFAGPMGPPGEPGDDGADGVDGEVGVAGKSGRVGHHHLLTSSPDSAMEMRLALIKLPSVATVSSKLTSSPISPSRELHTLDDATVCFRNSPFFCILTYLTI